MSGGKRKCSIKLSNQVKNIVNLTMILDVLIAHVAIMALVNTAKLIDFFRLPKKSKKQAINLTSILLDKTQIPWYNKYIKKKKKEKRLKGGQPTPRAKGNHSSQFRV